MLYFIVKNYRRNIVQNIIIIFMYFNLLIGLLFYVNHELFEIEYNRNIFVDFPTDAMYICAPFDGNIDEDDFIQVVDHADLNSHVGYVCSYLEHEKECLEQYVYLNEYMLKFEYPLQQGEWLKNDDEVIVGGDFSSEYKPGDSYYIGSTYIGTVAGILGKEYSFMFLNVSGEELSYKNIFSRSSENIIITNNKKMWDLFNMKISTRAIMADGYGYEKLEAEGYQLRNCEYFNQMQGDEYDLRQTHVNWLMMVLLVCSMILSSFYLLYIYVCKNARDFRVMWEQGYSYVELSVCLSVSLFIDIIVSYIGVRIYSFKVLKTDIVNHSLYDILLLFTAISFVCIFALTVNVIVREVKQA